MKTRLIKILIGLNIARRISDHLMGEDHPPKHRMGVGVLLMIVGVKIASIGAGLWFHFLFDMIGYMVHGTGFIPFIDWLTIQTHKEEDKQVQLKLEEHHE